MCGIIGYIGDQAAAPLLLNGLRRLEYRGYDSAGICSFHDDALHLKKDAGKIEEIHARHNLLDLPGTVGIAHTRWATHGRVSQQNAHPHVGCNGEIGIIHNGIIENFLALKRLLQRRGHRFASDTDSEVIAHLLEQTLKTTRTPREALLRTVRQLNGAFAFLAVMRDHPAILLAARKDAPLVIGVSSHGNFVASDVLAFIEHTDQAIFLDNSEIAIVGPRRVELGTFAGRRIRRAAVTVAWEASDISKKEFGHFTLKEIHEQPRTIHTAIYQDPDKLGKMTKLLHAASRVFVTACGTSYHSGLLAKQFWARRLATPVDVIYASEFEDAAHLLNRNALVLTISQSGETADVLEAVKLAGERGAPVVSLVNVSNSTLARVSELALHLNCGPEIGVAATKSFTAQVMILYQLAHTLEGETVQEQAGAVARAIETVLQQEKGVEEIARHFATQTDLYYIGRGLHYPVALEGALKLKELAYAHAEGMAAGELKHGTLALVSEGTPAIVINPDDGTYHATLSNAEEMRARGARIVGISDRASPVYDYFVPIPKVQPELQPIVEVVPLQLLAYYSAVLRQANPDYPRNLAKSVTVK